MKRKNGRRSDIFMKRAIMTLLLALVLALSSSPAIGAEPNFVDIDGHWARDAIVNFARMGIVGGTSATTFEPDGTVTREQFAKMMVLTFNAETIYPEENTFSDVNSTNWSYPYVETSKNFLTGYESPFGGKPVFQPYTPATREDMAVALVKIMGLNTTNITDNYYGSNVFWDFDEVSPNLKDYVVLAAEQGLINGYEDGSFRPQGTITRAECVTLLSRAMKTAAADISTELYIETGVDYYEYDPSEVCIWATTNEGASVTIGGVTVDTYSLGYMGQSNYVKGERVIKFTEEGSQDFEIIVSKGTKKMTKTETATYSVNAPVLNVTNCPANVSISQVTISGKVTDQNDDYPQLTINGDTVSIDSYSGSFSESYTLQEGTNTFAFRAENEMGKVTELAKTITYTPSGPVLTITDCPTTVTSKTVTISGTIHDANNVVTLKMNDKAIKTTRYPNEKADWLTTVNLNEGENQFIFVLTNDVGKLVTETRVIDFGVGLPKLTITDCPTTVTSKTATISGTFHDANYVATLKINDKTITATRYPNEIANWSTTFDLIEGENLFAFVLTNEIGKSVTETRTINFDVGGPKLTITDCPTTVTSKTATISGTFHDANYVSTLKINDKAIKTTRYPNETANWSTTINLNEGENLFTFVLTNEIGKSVTETRTINFNVGAPKLTITDCPTTVTSKTATISGTFHDANYSATLKINDKVIQTAKYPNETTRWSTTVDLSEGENQFTFVLTNEIGKSVTESRTINLTVGSPEINFTNCPEVTKTKAISIQGRITGDIDGVKLYIDDQAHSVSYDGSFSKSVTLSEGNNSFVFRAVNSYGKSTSVAKTIKYVAEIVPPVLNVDAVPSSTSQDNITISGSVQDAQDANVLVHVNDKQVKRGNGSWSTNVDLDENNNTIIIVATNSFGQSTTIVKEVSYVPPASENSPDSDDQPDITEASENLENR